MLCQLPRSRGHLIWRFSSLSRCFLNLDWMNWLFTQMRRDQDHERTPLVISGQNETYRTLDSPVAVPKRQLSVVDVFDAVTLSWDDVNVQVKEQTSRGLPCWPQKVKSPPKHIIKSVKGIVKPGTLMAIMGASGAGKSTLLNVLTQRNLEGLSVTGKVLVNGADLGRAVTKVSAYVQQDDLFMKTLTVKEHLWFYSQLRMDKSVSKTDREARVKDVMNELGLTKCENVMIGTAGGKKGISGGERKRLQFASEVLTNPALLFCDEPTSGLDSFMAMSVVQTLQNLAEKGKTILCTIHQPSSEVFALFSSVYLLAEGRLAFMGSTADALAFFQSCGYPCPVNFNPADHYIYTLAIIPSKEVQARETADKICDKFETSDAGTELNNEVKDLSNSDEFGVEVERLKKTKLYRASWIRQFAVVFWRAWIANARDPLVFRSRLAQGLITALLLGLVYFRQDYDTKGVMNINGAIFLLITSASLGNMFAVINTFPLEFPIFNREYQNGMYRVSVYYLAKIMAELPTFMLVPVLLMGVSYYMVGFYNNVVSFCIAAATLILVSNVAVSFGYMMSSLSSNVTAILALAPIVMTPLMLFGGFYLNSDSVPVYFIWLKYLSWFNYGNEILTVNQWYNVQNITCSLPGNSTLGDHTFCYPNGKAVIASLGYSQDNIIKDVAILLALMVGFRLVSFIFLYIRSNRNR